MYVGMLIVIFSQHFTFDQKQEMQQAGCSKRILVVRIVVLLKEGPRKPAGLLHSSCNLIIKHYQLG